VLAAEAVRTVGLLRVKAWDERGGGITQAASHPHSWSWYPGQEPLTESLLA
jgi:hypothetical protein